MTAVVDSGLFEPTMSLPLHNHFRLYRRRFLCLSSALLLACAFSQRSFAWPLLLRPDRLITTKLLGKIKTFLLYVKVFWTGFWALPSIVRLAFCVWDLCKSGTSKPMQKLQAINHPFETYVKLPASKIVTFAVRQTLWFETYLKPVQIRHF